MPSDAATRDVAQRRLRPIETGRFLSHRAGIDQYTKQTGFSVSRWKMPTAVSSLSWSETAVAVKPRSAVNSAMVWVDRQPIAGARTFPPDSDGTVQLLDQFMLGRFVQG